MRSNLNLSVPSPKEEESEFDLRSFAAQFLAQKWFIASCTTLGLFVGVFIGQLGPNSYRASAVVQIEKRDSGVLLPNEMIGMLIGQPSSSSSLDTEIHIIRSRLILGPVVDELGSDTRIAQVKLPYVGDIFTRRNVPVFSARLPIGYAQPGEKLRARFLETPADMIGTQFQLEIRTPSSFILTSPEGVVFNGVVGVPLVLGETHRLLVEAISAPPGREYSLWTEERRKSIATLVGGLSVRERGNTGIVDFRYNGEDPDQVKSIVNAIVASYQASNLERHSLQIDRSITFLEQQLESVRTDLTEARLALIDFREKQQSEPLSLNTQRILERAVAIETELEELRFRETELADRLTPNHPDYRALLLQRERAQERLEELRGDLEGLPETEQALARLTANLDRFTFLDQQLSERIEQLGVQRASTVGNIRVIEPAEISRLTGPDRRQSIFLGFFLGAIGAIGLVFLRNYLRSGIDDAKAIEELGLSLFATINLVDGLRAGGASSELYALANSHPNNLAVEAVRGLRTGLQFSLATASARSIMISSTAPNDGKSFISLNLAIVMGQSGSKVLLIDADMRKGALRRQFNLPRERAGLSDFLANRASIEDVIVSDDQFSCDFISTGSYPPNPADLLASPKFDEFLKNAAKIYDLVIVDAPPILAVSDPGVIGQRVGMSMIVVQHLVTTKAEIQAALKTLNGVGVNVSGVILNQFDAQNSRYGQYGTKYGYYYGGYSYKYD